MKFPFCVLLRIELLFLVGTPCKSVPVRKGKTQIWQHTSARKNKVTENEPQAART